MSACPMCMGTDCAGMCAQGWCYAEDMQRRFEEEEAERRYFEELYEDSCRAAEQVGKFAAAITKATGGNPCLKD